MHGICESFVCFFRVIDCWSLMSEPPHLGPLLRAFRPPTFANSPPRRWAGQGAGAGSGSEGSGVEPGDPGRRALLGGRGAGAQFQEIGNREKPRGFRLRVC